MAKCKKDTLNVRTEKKTLRHESTNYLLDLCVGKSSVEPTKVSLWWRYFVFISVVFILLACPVIPAMALNDLINHDERGSGRVEDVKIYGARCDNVTDNGPAFTKALADNMIINVSANGCGRNYYLIDSTVVVPEGHSVIGSSGSAEAAMIATTSANTTFIASGDHVVFQNLNITHKGAMGRVFDL